MSDGSWTTEIAFKRSGLIVGSGNYESRVHGNKTRLL